VIPGLRGSLRVNPGTAAAGDDAPGLMPTQRICAPARRYRARPQPGCGSLSAASARARIVVGADGIRSTIADRAGAAFERVGTSAAAVTYGYWSGLETDGYEWNFRPGAASGVIPTNHGQACVYASASPRRIGRGGLAPLTQIVADSSPDLAAKSKRAPAEWFVA